MSHLCATCVSSNQCKSNQVHNSYIWYQASSLNCYCKHQKINRYCRSTVKDWLDSTRQHPFVCCKVEVFSFFFVEGISVFEQDVALLFTFNILTYVSRTHKSCSLFSAVNNSEMRRQLRFKLWCQMLCRPRAKIQPEVNSALLLCATKSLLKLNLGCK